MRPKTLLPLLTLIATPALALDAVCESYLTAAEKSATQPARHTVTDPGDGSSYEAVVIGEQFFTRMSGPWRKMPTGNLLAGERSMVAAIRSGRYPITGCRTLGSERFEGTITTVIAYTLKVPGSPPEETRAYIGSDGLVYGQVSGKTKTRHRYEGVKAPAI